MLAHVGMAAFPCSPLKPARPHPATLRTLLPSRKREGDRDAKRRGGGGLPHDAAPRG
jgi:hypothetical protein